MEDDEREHLLGWGGLNHGEDFLVDLLHRVLWDVRAVLWDQDGVLLLLEVGQQEVVDLDVQLLDPVEGFLQ